MHTLTRLVLACAALSVAMAAYWASYQYFRSEELVDARARLSLYRSTVVAELERFSHMPFILARDPIVLDVAEGGAVEPLNVRLAAFAEQAGIDAIYLMDTAGITRSASNAGTDRSFVGQDYSFRPYFQAALEGRQGRFYGIGATTGLPGYFFAEPVVDGQGALVGVIAIKIDLSALQNSWRAGGEQVILANRDGIVLLSSEPDWLYRAMQPLEPRQVTQIADSRQFTGQNLEPLSWLPADDVAEIGGARQLYVATDALPYGWSLHYFAADDRAVARSWLVTAALVLAAGLAFIIVQVQRTRRIGEALRQSEQEEAQLREANDRLAVEIEDRRTAERKLQRTQSELERAGRLAALGQLSASVTHELGQPIAAMRNHLAAAEMQSGDTPLTNRLQGLVDRMEGITRQLKFFARKGRDNFEDFDLRDAMRAVLELMEPNLKVSAVAVSVDLPATPVMFHGNRLRLEQVMTNLLRNALDAVDGLEAPRIEVRMGGDRDVWFEVRDTGHGLGSRTFEELREPFTTTRESGQGMGLGLTISAGIVDDHGGTMVAENHATGGAVFRASFPAEDGA